EQRAVRTRDGGLHWEAISPDVTGGGAAGAGAGPTAAADTGPTIVANAAARGYGVVYTIAPSPRAAGLLWVGSDDGLIHRSSDGGGHWRHVPPPRLRASSTIH